MADVYHTFFGIAGLALMGYPNLGKINPTWALPEDVVQRLLAQQQQRREEGSAQGADGPGAEQGADHGLAAGAR